jgi:hypothetical protein
MYHYYKGTSPYTKMQHSATDSRKNHDKRNAPNASLKTHHSSSHYPDYIPQIRSSVIPHTQHMNIPDITSHSSFVTAHSNTGLNTPQTIESIVLAMGRSPGANDQASQPREAEGQTQARRIDECSNSMSLKNVTGRASQSQTASNQC